MVRLLIFLAGTVLCTSAIAQTRGAEGEVLGANAAATGSAAWERNAVVRAVYAYAGAGLNGKIETDFDVRTGAYVETDDFGPAPEADGFDGRQVWERDISGAVTPMGADADRKLAVSRAYRNANLWCRPNRGGARITSLGHRSEGAKAYDVLSVEPKAGVRFEAWFDASTHLLARTVEPRAFWTVTTFFSDYRNIGGALTAGRILIDDGSGESHRTSQVLTDALFLPSRPQDAYSAPHIQLTDASMENSTGRTTVPFQLLNNHIYINVIVNGEGVHRFIVDTGGFAVLTPEMANVMSVTAQGATTARGVGAGVVQQGFARNVTFRIGDLIIKNRAIRVLPITNPAVEGFSQEGMVGFELFRRFVTQIDYGSRTITFMNPPNFTPGDAGFPVPFVFNDLKPQVTGTFEGLPAKFNIDTGSRLELTLTSPFVKEHDLISTHPKGVAAVDGWGVGGPSRSYIVRAGNLTLGSVKVDNFIAGLSTETRGGFANPDFSGNVGSALLKRFVVTFDYMNRIMYLNPLPTPVADTGVFDRSGMWINAGDHGFKVVDLTPGGSAQAAGIKVGEEIVAVDGIPTASISLSDLRARFRDGLPGESVSLIVEDSAGSRPVNIRLRDEV